MRRATRITILGTDGSKPDPDLHQIWQAVIPEARAHFGAAFDFDVITADRKIGDPIHPQRAWCTDRVMERFHVYFDAAAHNQLVDPLNELVDLDTLTENAVVEVEHLYADLSKNTTINWLAAHHRFTLATIRARDLLTRRAALSADLAGRRPDILEEDTSKYLAARYYQEHIPADQRLDMPTEADADRHQDAVTDFTGTAIARFDALRATVTGAYPPGFAPLTNDDTTARELLDGVDWPASTAVTHGGQAMRIPGPRPGTDDAHARTW